MRACVCGGGAARLYGLYESVEIPTRCSFVIEFIIPKLIEGSICFDQLDQLIHFPLSLGNGRSPHGYMNQKLQIRVQFRAPDDERCAARNMLSLQETLE